MTTNKTTGLDVGRLRFAARNGTPADRKAAVDELRRIKENEAADQDQAHRGGPRFEPANKPNNAFTGR